MAIKPVIGKWYQLDNGIVGIANDRGRNCVHSISISGFYFDTDGKHATGNYEITSEVTITPALGFELKAGERYETVKPDGTEGPVVTLKSKSYERSFMWSRIIPFGVRDRDDYYAVTPGGELVNSQRPLDGTRIVRPYVEPKPPGPAERFTAIRDKIVSFHCYRTDLIAELDAAIADLKAGTQ